MIVSLKRVHVLGVSSFTVWLLAGHLFLPAAAFYLSPRDSDMGLWFCGGVILCELSFFALICICRIGQLQWRLLAASSINLLLLLIALFSASFVADMSKEDALCLLSLLAGASASIGLLDLVVFVPCGIFLVRENSIEEKMGLSEPSQRGIRFSLLFLTMFVALSAVAALMVSQSLALRNASYRSFRNYYEQGFPFLFLLATFFWALHFSLLFATLGRRVKWVIAAVAVLATLGTESIRRTEEWKNSVKLDYLNWEFSMIVFGFVIAHVLVGMTIRWLGWELRSFPNALAGKG